MIQIAGIPHSDLPERLLRIDIGCDCNYRCRFCCWEKKQNENCRILSSKEYQLLVQAAVASGCRRVMLTGGEPLILSRTNLKQLIEIIEKISSVAGLKDFWITTNGSELNGEDLCANLYSAGLRKLVVSIAAATNKSYRWYSRSNTSLDSILHGIKCATLNNIEVRVDVPLVNNGVDSIEDFQLLVAKVKEVGVKKIAYFSLHRTIENSADFDALKINSELITSGLMSLDTWAIQSKSSGQKIFTDGEIEIIIPAKKIQKGVRCQAMRCNDYCQGTYAAYLKSTCAKVLIRACHRHFNNDMNVFTVVEEWLCNKDVAALTRLFDHVWQFTSY